MAFCTLAVNSPYNKRALELSRKISNLHVLTDHPEWFKSNAFLFKDDKTHIWQQKRHIIKETLRYNKQAIFIDSDIILFNSIAEPVLDNTISGYVVGTVKGYTSFHKNTAWPILDRLSCYLGVDWHQAAWVSPMLFGVKANSSKFLETWDNIAFWLRDNGGYIFNDGNTIGLAALAAGLVPKQESVYKSIYDSFSHLRLGDWRQKNILA